MGSPLRGSVGSRWRSAHPFCFVTILIAVATVAGAQNPSSRTLAFAGQKRAYQLFVPEKTAAGPAPLIVLLHGYGGNGQRLMGPWQDFAREQGIALLAPNSFSAGWVLLKGDGPDFFQALIETVKKDVAIDVRRVYLFGHSSGGHQALALGPLEAEYFAAVAVHAGVLNPSEAKLVQQARRKIPIGMWHGTADDIVPLRMGRETRDMFKSLDFPVSLTEITSHTHDYYSRSKTINAEVWNFLKAHALSADPVYRPYTFKR